MPLCIEKKQTLSGEIQTYSCELVRLDDDFGVLKYVIDRNYTVAGIRLAPGDMTYAFYWTDRPYTLYTWNSSGNDAIVYYFNVADRIVLSQGEFSWRDLAVDILIDGQGKPHVLDEHELPAGLDDELAGYIEKAKDHLLTHFRDIIKEAEEHIASYSSGSSSPQP